MAESPLNLNLGRPYLFLVRVHPRDVLPNVIGIPTAQASNIWLDVAYNLRTGHFFVGGLSIPIGNIVEALPLTSEQYECLQHLSRSKTPQHDPTAR